jgi:hypothetical protein
MKTPFFDNLDAKDLALIQRALLALCAQDALPKADFRRACNLNRGVTNTLAARCVYAVALKKAA